MTADTAKWKGTFHTEARTAGRTTMITPKTDAEALQLSAIYRRLLDDIDGLYEDNDRVQEGSHHRLPSGLYDQAVELISGAVGEALQVVSQRCSRCDSSNISISCMDCAVDPLGVAHGGTTDE